MLAMQTLMMPAPIPMGPTPIPVGPHKPPEAKLLAIHPTHSQPQSTPQHQIHQQQNSQQQSQQQQSQQQIAANNKQGYGVEPAFNLSYDDVTCMWHHIPYGGINMIGAVENLMHTTPFGVTRPPQSHPNQMCLCETCVFDSRNSAKQLKTSTILNPSIGLGVGEIKTFFKQDDGSLGGRGENVIEDLTTIKYEFSLYGLELNPSKCEVYVLPNVGEERKKELLHKIDTILPGIKLISKNELTLLGAPLTIDAIDSVIDAKNKVLSNYLERLMNLQPHVALYLLQHCLWIPKFTYLFRCCPLFNFENFLNNMDRNILNTLEGILNLQLNENSHLQCFLPIKYGGLGIRLMSDIATSAFIASYNSSQFLLTEILPTSFRDVHDKNYSDALNKWQSMCPNEDFPENLNIQQEWDLPQINNKVRLISESSLTARARMLALTQKESGGWLQALPSPYFGSLLDSDSLRIASGIRLGAKICQPYTCVCGFPVDEYGTHGLSCISKKGTFLRHFNLNDLLSKGLSTACFPNILEPQGLVRTDGNRADGLTITPWINGKSLVWDATCVDTIASSYLHLTSKNPGAAANLACIKKERLYKDIVVNHHFLPFAVETFGSFSDPAKKFMKQFRPILNSKSGNERSASFFMQKISITIQRGNVAGILGTIPVGVKMKEIFYIH